MKKLITSALPYINGVKHIGNLIGSILPADIYARYLRQLGEEVLFICGTDEHGTPAEIGANNSGIPIEIYCENNYNIQKSIYQSFNISFDYFGRTSSLVNHKFVNKIFSILDKNGFIFSDMLKQFYSIDDKRFLPDRYIEGTCPLCKFSFARGDQCDNCGTLTDPVKLIHPRSVISPSSKLKLTNSKHLFFNFTKMESRINTWLKDKTNWPNTVKGIINKWIKEGLKARCITRDLKWGIKVPKLGFKDKVLYVWFDALLGYISITQEWSILIGQPEKWREWWQKPSDVELTQFMAKDNVPFHAIFFPAIMMATNKNWTLPNFIKGLNWLTYEGNKFSTSRRKGVFIDEALTIFPADYWRYALFCMIPENKDSDFSFEDMARIINKDLADNLGNFINRLAKLILVHFKGKLPVGYYVDNNLNKNLTNYVIKYYYHMDRIEYRKVINIIRQILKYGNEYFTHKEPWCKVQSNRIEAVQILKSCIWILWIYSFVLSPIVPNIALNIRSIMPKICFTNLNFKKIYNNQSWLQSEIDIDFPKNLFISKINKDKVDFLVKTYSK